MPRTIGLANTSSTSGAPLNNKTYNEQSANGQRSLKSSSANDTAAGTGARRVKVTYFAIDSSGVVTGPFSEIVTMNGTTAVPLVATNVCFIERMDAVSVGSNNNAAGDITLYANNDGTGTAIAVLAASDNQTFLGHHYVATGARCKILDVQVQGGDAAASLIFVKRQALPAANQPDAVLLGPYSTSASLPVAAPTPGTMIAGPCRVRLIVIPPNNNAQTTVGSFGYVDEQNILQGVSA